ncbi:TPA: 6-carboxytetrahydropterin synthase [Clostridioides difficile]|uniref:6-carboxytetrahydropterin synthase n=1 Tax=Clostridioides difficile TaxID=1496 RepID=UPI00038D3B1C|nr:6-carboxytetrahydropterin synthase [Clostridioides difficile]EGT4019436.1 6-carboxytetrahydropterin synthase [Clostridioides difficile]EGT4186477.1 6-carboxytetrahydropterin synthase [Clostridioides difficile]EGT4218124.1 6-carboxytetrahydropterin synthase [Clostridioides difficile]EGT5475258.1 6-carboxytetrahydropterin synthase [Clostridioides difficile]EJA6850497.1 6-carboxytetrahydropterin synthase [Clostridioides difficile]
MIKYATVICNFESGHFLAMGKKTREENSDIYGKCVNMHGHNYKLHVTVRGDISENGMIINFSKIKEIINKKIVQVFDHKVINDVINEIPTAENMCCIIWNILNKEFNLLGIVLSEIILFETDKSYVTFKEQI